MEATTALRIARRNGDSKSTGLIEMMAQQEGMVLGHAATKGVMQCLR